MQRRVAYLQLEILIRSLVKWTFWAFGRPFEAVRADDGVSRRDECISTGREARIFSERSGGRFGAVFGGRHFLENPSE